ncbi:MAG TPA: carotenoid oxygenase family protein [Acidimicrobiales bacterium]|nr:carotenoid oxygenase family protein [Acidimicrobiales bacterium]
MIHLAGNNGPVDEEREAVPTRVVGNVPAALLGGVFVRNGPNPRTGWSPHLYAGDGMLHAVSFGADDTSITYRNRWVRTPLWEESSFARDGVDHTRTTANTHVVSHAGRLLALEEGGYPYEVRAPSCDTVGAFTFDGALTTPMTAHPKTCPRTGELYFFGTQVVAPPFLTLWRATPTGAIDASLVVDLDGPTMMHDFAITATHVVLFLSPWTFDVRGMPPWRWLDDTPARIGVVPRTLDAPVRWFETSPSHLSHAANAWDGDDRIVLTGTRLADATSLPYAHRWDVDLATGVVHERALDDEASEYPRVPDSLAGMPSPHAWTTSFVYEAEPDHHEIHRYDLTTGDRLTHALPTGHTCGEPVPVADTGLLVTFAHSRGSGTSYVLVLDGVRVEPVCEIHLAVRVPGGFHGSWLPADR